MVMKQHILHHDHPIAQGCNESFVCSHDGCNTRLPNSHMGQEMPPGWTVARVEEHNADTVKIYYIYLCPSHRLTTTERQTNLFPTGATA